LFSNRREENQERYASKENQWGMGLRNLQNFKVEGKVGSAKWEKKKDREKRGKRGPKRKGRKKGNLSNNITKKTNETEKLETKSHPYRKAEIRPAKEKKGGRGRKGKV